MTCGDCRGLTRDALLPTAEKPCATQGQLPDAKICKHYRPDSASLTTLMSENGDSLIAMFNTVKDFSTKDLHVVAGLLLREAKTRSYGVRIGQAVFVRYQGRETRNYLNNFMAARVLDVDDETIRLISEKGDIVLTYANTGFSGPSVYSKQQFTKLRKEMKASGKLIDPERQIKTTKRMLPMEDNVSFSAPSSLDGFSIPMMDEVVKGRGAKRKGKKTNTLVDIVSMIDNGYDMGAEQDESGVMSLGSNSYKNKGKRIQKGAVELSDLEG
ncbi:hypothetical protein pEaSNUABM25_00338 [Erwinia phage pEa_SNUABM_25]|nr:hypothetical protein pEaSNUABM45_00339 [Erwinia phage pEa_SNUABM_45]QYW04323.1 hypothetical protein pEaSNUABM46_00339 [Erwinia phage pEa_SNUABM_46]QYW05694.1 hypothetical protein pEaSNUABM25_00338 [Erwinia phage pEa_SNUABM_25]